MSSPKAATPRSSPRKATPTKASGLPKNASLPESPVHLPLVPEGLGFPVVPVSLAHPEVRRQENTDVVFGFHRDLLTPEQHNLVVKTFGQVVRGRNGFLALATGRCGNTANPLQEHKEKYRIDDDQFTDAFTVCHDFLSVKDMEFISDAAANFCHKLTFCGGHAVVLPLLGKHVAASGIKGTGSHVVKTFAALKTAVDNQQVQAGTIKYS